MKALKITMITALLGLSMGIQTNNVNAKELDAKIPTNLASDIESRGATDYHYQLISYKIQPVSAKTFQGTKTFKGGVSATYSYMGLSITINFGGSGTYKKYTYRANVTYIARQVDAMGHNLGTVNFVNKGVEMVEYVPV